MTGSLSTSTALSKHQQNLVIFALAVGAFALGVGEFASMGLMLEMSRGLQVSDSQIGMSISAYAIGVVIGAPILAFAGARLKRKTLLLLLALLYGVGNIATALAPSYEFLVLSRFISGLPHGTYFGIATLIAASVSAPSQKGIAVSKVMLGLSVAILAGNPIAVALGQHLSWRLAFTFVGALAILTVIMVSWSVPSPADEKKTDPAAELADFNRAPIWLALLIGLVGFSGMFTVFSYLAPILVHVTKASELWMPWLVVAFGAGSIIGMLVGGRLADRLAFKSIGLILVWSILVLILFPWAAQSLWSIVVGTLALGTMMAMPVALQAHLMNVAGNAQILSAASIQAALNAANALGPIFGGLAIDHGLGYHALGPIGAAASLAGLLIWIYTNHRSKTDAAKADT